MALAHSISSLDMLPPELSTPILSYLAASEVARMRRVSKTLLALVDANLTSILAPIQARARHSLEQFVNDTLKFGKNVSFHHALGRLIKHRGYWPLYTDCTRTTSAFMMLWLYNLEGGPPPYHFVGPERNMARDLFRLARTLQELHLQCHAPQYQRFTGQGEHLQLPKNDTPDRDAFVRLLGNSLAVRRYGLDSSYLGTMYREICEPTHPALGGPLHGLHSDDDDGDGPMRVRTPQWPLTATHVTESDWHDGDARQRMKGLCSMKCVVAKFDVPELPELPDTHDRFAYCVKSEWAYRVIETAVRSRKRLGKLVKTAILEELHIP
ncbi:hypothetical protein LTR17_007594 [Elasticomyces elasticus]|nr:hypothetical protein LTR17_007594 [Elasticomyces elasticus]